METGGKRQMGQPTYTVSPGMSWAVLPSHGSLEAKLGQQDLGGESGATGTQENGEEVREGREFPSRVYPSILP